MKPIIAVCGKGGVGKTTISALLLHLLHKKEDTKVLAVDADPAGGLAMALARQTGRSIDDVRRTIIASAKEKLDKKDLLASVDFELFDILDEKDNLALMTVGRSEEAGCYCKLNALLRGAIESLATQFDVTLIDAEAGLEQVNRRVMRAVTHLLLVSDPTQKGIRVAENIYQLAREATKVEQAGLVINRVWSDQKVKTLTDRVTMPLLGTLPEDNRVREQDLEARSFLQMETCPALTALDLLVMKSGFLEG